MMTEKFVYNYYLNEVRLRADLYSYANCKSDIQRKFERN